MNATKIIEEVLFIIGEIDEDNIKGYIPKLKKLRKNLLSARETQQGWRPNKTLTFVDDVIEFTEALSNETDDVIQQEKTKLIYLVASVMVGADW